MLRSETFQTTLVASRTQQNHLNQIHTWLQKWKIKINKNKSTLVIFAIKRDHWPLIHLNNISIPPAPSTKHLSIHLDKITWKEHIVMKRKQIDLKVKTLTRMIGRRSVRS